MLLFYSKVCRSFRPHGSGNLASEKEGGGLKLLNLFPQPTALLENPALWSEMLRAPREHLYPDINSAAQTEEAPETKPLSLPSAPT